MRRTAPASVRLPCCSADNDLENPPREPSHAFATRPTGACENKLPQKLRCIQNDLLSDHSSDREPEDIHLLGAERMDEGDDVARIRGIESGVTPLERPTLLSSIEHHETVLSESVGVDGSHLSILPVKCWRQTRAGPPPSRTGDRRDGVADLSESGLGGHMQIDLRDGNFPKSDRLPLMNGAAETAVNVLCLCQPIKDHQG